MSLFALKIQHFHKVYRPRLACKSYRYLYLLFIILYLSFIISPDAYAQIGSWQVYPAYTVCNYNLPVGHRVYAIMEGKLMAYDTDDGSITTFDWQQQLSDVSISFIHYSAEAKRIIIIYDNGNIDLLSTEDDYDVINLAQLKNSSIQNKTVNNVQISGKWAYVCTDFGLVLIDMKQGLIKDSYETGFAVKSCAVSDQDIYISGPSGLWKGSMSQNLKDKVNWQLMNASYKADHMEYFDGCLWVQVYGWLFASNKSISAFGVAVKDIGSNMTYMTQTDGQLICGNANHLFVIEGQNKQQHYQGDYSWSWLTKKGNTYWASDGSNGLQGYKISEDGTLSLTVQQLHPNSPLHDYSLQLRIAGDDILVAGGNRNYATTSRAGTAMVLRGDGTWVNMNSESVASLFPDERYMDVTYIVQDPSDSQHHYVGTARSGVFEFRNAKCVGHYGIENSPLQSILPNSSKPQTAVVADGLTFDNEGNLWMLNPTEGRESTTIRILKTDGTWTGIPCPEIKEAPTPDKIFFDSRGWAWINSRRIDSRGILMLDYNGTLSTTSDDIRKFRSTIVNQDGANYVPDNFYDIAEDKDGSIWIATHVGPFVIREPEQFRNSDFTFEQVKVSRNDGSNLADYLFTGIPILSLAIDGAGRKWFGTMDNGVYLVSEDCQEEIYHFTTDNSPLPSNEITDIAIHPTSGRVFFATNKGLCSYLSDATEGAEELEQDSAYAMPNPVSPDYNGPIAIRGLVKDSEVKIVSVTGQLVASGTSNGGTFTWNGCNKSGRRVATGIYHVIATTPDGETAIATRITIIR